MRELKEECFKKKDLTFCSINYLRELNFIYLIQFFLAMAENKVQKTNKQLRLKTMKRILKSGDIT